MVSVGAWDRFDSLKHPHGCSGGWLPRRASKVPAALIIALPGRASKLSGGHKVVLEALLDFLGEELVRREAVQQGERSSLPERLALFTRQKRKILLEQFSVLVLPPPSPREPLPRQTHVLVLPKLCKSVGQRACEAAMKLRGGKAEGWRCSSGLLCGRVLAPELSTAVPVPTRCQGAEAEAGAAVDSRAPPVHWSLALLVGTPLA